MIDVAESKACFPESEDKKGSLPLKYEVTDNKSSFLCVCKKHTYTQIDLNFMSLR